MKKYDTYKDSGVEWSGYMPNRCGRQWLTIKIGFWALEEITLENKKIVWES
jgi:hypothetical protein